MATVLKAGLGKKSRWVNNSIVPQLVFKKKKIILCARSPHHVWCTN